MATLTVRCKAGDATVELLPDETAEQTGARLTAAINALGGCPDPDSLKRVKAKLMTIEERRHEEMTARGLLECGHCGTWIPPMRAAAERHQRKCTPALAGAEG